MQMDDEVKLGCFTRSEYLKIARLFLLSCLRNNVLAFEMQGEDALRNLEWDYFCFFVQQPWRQSRTYTMRLQAMDGARHAAGAPPAVVPDFSGPAGDTAVPH